MGWEDVPNIGSILEESDLEDDTGSRVSNAMLHSLARTIARKTLDFHKRYDFLPFDNEVQSSSVVLPSLTKVCGPVIAEYTIKRKKQGRTEREKHKKRTGFADYIMLYRHFLFLLELKKSGWGLGTEDEKITTLHKWEDGTSQIDDISREEIEKDLDYKRRGTMGITQLIVTGYEAGHDGESLKGVNRDYSEQFLANVTKQLSPKPNWSAAWMLPQRARTEENLVDRRPYYMSIPIVLFLCKVKPK